MQRPSVRQLEYVVALAEHLSFREAAQACHISQPALSAQIANLEDILNIQLFERNRRRVLATPAGEHFAAGARRVLMSMDTLVGEASGNNLPFSGALRLGVIPTMAPYILPQVLPEVRRAYPDLMLYLREDQTEHLLARLARGELDVLLLALEAELGAVDTLPLFRDRFCVALPVNDPLCRYDRLREKHLNHRAVLLLEDGHCLRDQTWSVCKTAGAYEVVDFRATSLITLSEMVASGVGITLLPEMAKASLKQNKKIVLRSFGKKGPARTVALAWRRSAGRARVAEFRALGNILKRAIMPA